MTEAEILKWMDEMMEYYDTKQCNNRAYDSFHFVKSQLEKKIKTLDK